MSATGAISPWGDVFIDLTTDPFFNGQASSTNTTCYQGDQIHLVDLCEQRIGLLYFLPAVQWYGVGAEKNGNGFGTVDLTQASHTLPMKAGTAASKPATCAVGEEYFATDTTAGQNLYFCTATNSWTPQGTGISDPGVNGVMARTGPGLSTARTITAGPGITVINGDGVSGNPTVSINTNVGLTNANAQANKPWLCTSSTANTNYACTLSAAAPLTAYTPGMCVDLLVDTSNSGVATLNIDGLGVKSIKSADGVSDPPANQIAAGRVGRICFDGTVFRLPAAVPLTAVSLNGALQGTYTALNLVTPTGLNWSLSPNGQTLGIAPTPDTSSLLSQSTAQNGTPFICAPVSNNSTAYTCDLTPAPSGLSNGMLALLRPDVSCSGGGTTLNINSLGAKPVYSLDGASNPAANDCRANRPTWLSYSGALNGGNGAFVMQSISNLPAQGPILTNVPFSPTPTFVVTGPIQEFAITLTGNVTSSTLAGAGANNVLVFQVCQDSTGGRTFVWPSGFGGASISPTAGTCTKQVFTWDGSNASPSAPATSTDTPFLISGAPERAAPAMPASGLASLWPDSTRHTWTSMENNNGTVHIMPRTSSTGDQLACGDLANAAASCSTDATNASNISSGTLPGYPPPPSGAYVRWSWVGTMDRLWETPTSDHRRSNARSRTLRQ